MKYIVKEDERLVIAIMENTAFDVVDFLKANQLGFNFMPGVEFMPCGGVAMKNSAWDKFLIKTEYIGRAKCHEDDVFDVELGKKLAKTRARAKHDLDFHKAVENALMDAEERIDIIRDKNAKKLVSAARWLDETIEEIRK